MTSTGARPGRALGDPLRLGGHRLRNRIAFPAHLTNAARDGRPTGQHAAYYAARAAGGAALIVTEEHSAAPDDRPYEHLIRGTDPGIVPGCRAITGAVHAHGAVVLAQIGHNGGQSSSRFSHVPLLAPSPLPDPMFREVPRVTTPADLAAVVAGFARTAEHCAAGGYDGVEVQASQASLLRQFLSPTTNHRDDAYGRDRVRLLREVLAAVRSVLGPDRLLGVRVPGDEGVPGGLDAADAAATAREVEPWVDYVSTAVGVATATLPMIEPAMGVPAGYAAHVSSAVRAAVSVPVLGAGRFVTPAQAADTLAAGRCDLVGVVRGQIADPAFAARAVAGRAVRRCLGCNQDCIARVGLGRTLGCVVNPRAGREAVALPAPGPRRRVLVVGGGPAGLCAAVTAAGRGHDVTLLEATDRLGGQVALAATAPWRSELGHLVTDLVTGLDPVRVRRGTPVDPDVVAAHAPDLVVDATGSAPARPGWAHPGVLDVTDVLAGAADPCGRVLVVDEAGGHAAPSTAELLARRGAAVTLMTSALTAAGDLGPTLERERWLRRTTALGVTTAPERVVLAARPGAVEVLHHVTDERETWRVDAVVVAGVRRARGLAVPDGIAVRRVGDAVAPRDAGTAVRDGHDAVTERG